MTEDSSEKARIKYGEWRPIGVCDTAGPGLMKANTFSKKDFEKVSSANVDRNNWQQNPEVMKIVQQYAKKLSKRSTLTEGMKQPKVNGIKLVGSLMHISKTPRLNKESRDGKVQFFQVEFKDGSKIKEKKGSRKLPWIWILIGSLSMILILLIIAMMIKPEKMKSVSPRTFKSAFQNTRFCSDSRDSETYAFDLDEAQSLLRQSLDENSTLCNLLSGTTQTREQQFIRCYQGLKQKKFPIVPSSDLRKINACLQRICAGKDFQDNQVCQ